MILTSPAAVRGDVIPDFNSFIQRVFVAGAALADRAGTAIAGKFNMKTLLKIVCAVALVYGAGCAGLYAVMRQSPDAFSATMKHMPDAAFMVLPFRSLWMNARTGALRPGDIAPDFDLGSVDEKSHLRLSTLRGSRPVVLVFGSYT